MSPRHKNKKPRAGQVRRRPAERGGRRAKPKTCYFCDEKVTYIDYKDVAVLRKFLSDRSKIRSSRISGTCPRHQHKLATAIKNSREMALLAYLAR